MSEPLSDDFMASYDAALQRLIDGVANRQRVVDAALARKAGCICGELSHCHDDLPEVFSFSGIDHEYGGWAIHDPRCPQAIAEAIEKGGGG